MPEYLSPGVYVEEIPGGARPIEGVSTSTAGSVGLTERGPTRPRLVTSWGDFASWYGGIIDPATSYLPFAVRGFFDNGGQRMFVARVTRTDAVPAQLTVATAGGVQTVAIAAMGPGAWGNRIFLRIAPGTLDHPADPLRRLLRITLLYYRVAPPLPFVDPLDRANIADPNRRVPDVVEDYDNLGVLPSQPDFFIARMTAQSRLIELDWGDPNGAADLPTPTGGFVQLDTVAGTDGVAALNAAVFQGDPAAAPDARTGLAALAGIDQISILIDAGRGQRRRDPQRRRPRSRSPTPSIDQCELLRDRFAVLQPRPGDRRRRQRGLHRHARYELCGRLLSLDPGDRPRDLAHPPRPAGRPRRRDLRAHGHRARRPQGAGQRGGARHRQPRRQRDAQAARVPRSTSASRTSSTRAAST